MKQAIKGEEFSTKDLLLSSFLRYSGMELCSGYDPNTKCWIFSDPEKCEELSIQLRNGNVSVEPLKFESCRRNLLGMTYDRKNKG